MHRYSAHHPADAGALQNDEAVDGCGLHLERLGEVEKGGGDRVLGQGLDGGRELRMRGGGGGKKG
jgi:hypothetical protein